MPSIETTGSKMLKFDAFRRNLSNIVDSKGILWKELAKDSNVSPATLSRYMSGLREPDIECVYRISKYLGCTMDWLLGLEEHKTSIMTKDAREVADLYTLASPEDQAVIQMVLRKYKDNR